MLYEVYMFYCDHLRVRRDEGWGMWEQKSADISDTFALVYIRIIVSSYTTCDIYVL